PSSEKIPAGNTPVRERSRLETIVKISRARDQRRWQRSERRKLHKMPQPHQPFATLVPARSEPDIESRRSEISPAFMRLYFALEREQPREMRQQVPCRLCLHSLMPG